MLTPRSFALHIVINPFSLRRLIIQTLTMQSIVMDHSDDFYHNLLNSFLESARVNPNSFFELRIQNGSLRHKFTTTDRPDPSGYRNNVSQNRMAYFRNTPAPQPLSPRASFYNIPASKQHSHRRQRIGTGI